MSPSVIAAPDSNIDKLLFRGRKLSKDFAGSVSSATLDAGVDMASEITLVFNDPGFALLGSGFFTKYTPVTYEGMKLVVSVIETDAGNGGRGQTTIRCRPKAVIDLRKRRGKFVMNNVTASEFIRHECEAVGAGAVMQQTSKRQQIIRDVKEKGESYSATDYPSSWTTFLRLADECGYLIYEHGGIIYFGTPTWLAANRPKVLVTWSPEGTESANQVWSVPTFRDSLDSEDVEVTVTVPLDRYQDMKPGNALVVQKFPRYSGTYLITNVNYPLVGPGKIEVTAKTTHKLV